MMFGTLPMDGSRKRQTKQNKKKRKKQRKKKKRKRVGAEERKKAGIPHHVSVIQFQ